MDIWGYDGNGTGNASDIKLGLDLAGGVSITYQAVGEENPSETDMSDTIYKLQQRVAGYSTEAQVYQEGSNRIAIEIPGVTDAETILAQLGRPGALYFINQTDSNGNPNYSDQIVMNDDGSYGQQTVLTKSIDELMADGSIEETIRYIEMGEVIEADVVDIEYDGDKVFLILDDGTTPPVPEPDPEPEPKSDPEPEPEPEEGGEAEAFEEQEGVEEAAEETEEVSEEIEAEAEKVGVHAKTEVPGEVKVETKRYRKVEAASPTTLAGRDIAESIAAAKGHRAIITIGTSAKYSLTNRLLKELRGKVVALELL